MMQQQQCFLCELDLNSVPKVMSAYVCRGYALWQTGTDDVQLCISVGLQLSGILIEDIFDVRSELMCVKEKKVMQKH